MNYDAALYPDSSGWFVAKARIDGNTKLPWVAATAKIIADLVPAWKSKKSIVTRSGVTVRTGH